MPVRNDAAHLPVAVAAALAQDYPHPLEVCLAVAPSTDDSVAVAKAMAAADGRITVVDNPSGRTPSALNAAIAATSGDVVVRVDARSELCADYITTAVRTLMATGAANVGGIQQARGDTAFEQAVATAMSSWLGTGGARFRLGGSAGPVDTVYLGVFDRQALEGVGGFDEDLIRNQDYELNIRLRQAGGVVWFDPSLHATYRPRGSLRTLARQYYEYGWWKAEVARRHPTSLRARQLAPVVAVVGLGAATVTATRVRAALVVPAAYAALVGVAAVGSGAGNPGRTARLAMVLPTMHLCWGAGFVAGWTRRVVRGTPETRPRGD